MSLRVLCACGCGQPTTLAQRTITRIAQVKGQPNRYVLGHHDRTSGLRRRGERRSAATCSRISESRKGKGKGNRNAQGARSAEVREAMVRRPHRGPVGAVERLAISERTRGERNSNWRGGIHMDHGGYRQVRAIGHPYASRHGYVLEHRLVMERILGRYLLPGEEVHHRNRIKTDNRPSNLEFCATHREHMQRHHNDLLAIESAIATLRRQRPELLAPGVA